MALIVTVEEAETYFSTRRSSGEWSNLSTGDDTVELTTAQNQLALFYTLDEENEVHKNAVCEQALFNIKYGDGIEDRLSQRISGLIEAGLIKEKFDPKLAATVAICPYAMTALQSVRKAGTTGFFFGMVPLERDET